MSQPKISSQQLVRYIEAQRPSERAKILRDQKSALGKKFYAPYYRRVTAAVRAHHRGDDAALIDLIAKLTIEINEQRVALKNAGPDERGKLRVRIVQLQNNLRGAVDYLENFGDHELDHDALRFPAAHIEGVIVTGEPTLSGKLVRKKTQIGCNVLVDFHEAEPTEEGAMLNLELMHEITRGRRPVALRGLQLWHPGRGASWELPRLSVRRMSDIKSACSEIAARWDLIPER